MNSEQTDSALTDDDRRKRGLEDPRALQILTTEHWSLLSTRALGYQEMLGRATIFMAALSGTVVALALLAQATNFGPKTLSFALPLVSVALLVALGASISLVSGAIHVLYAARFRRSHVPSMHKRGLSPERW